MQLIIGIAQFSGQIAQQGQADFVLGMLFEKGLGVLVGRLQLTGFAFLQNIGQGHLFDQRVAQRGVRREAFEQLRGDQCRRGVIRQCRHHIRTLGVARITGFLCEAQIALVGRSQLAARERHIAENLIGDGVVGELLFGQNVFGFALLRLDFVRQNVMGLRQCVRRKSARRQTEHTRCNG